MEVKVIIKGIDNLKTSTGVKVEKDKEGDIIDQELITRVQFEAAIDPSSLANVHRLMAAQAPACAIIFMNGA